MLSKIAIGAAVISSASAAGTAEWKGRAVYQVLTDRFAKSNGNENDGACTNLSDYCGGTWKGIEKRTLWLLDSGPPRMFHYQV